MIEKIALDYLDGKLTEPVYMETPNPVPSGSYVLIEKTGGSKKNQISGATLAIQSISDSMLHAATLNNKVIDEMEGLISVASVFKAQLETDYCFTDKTTKQYRYQAVFNIKYKET